MSKPRAAMMKVKKNQIAGTLHINGQVVVGKATLTMPVFEVDAGTHDTKKKREQALIDFALEQNPDLVLTRPSQLYDQ